MKTHGNENKEDAGMLTNIISRIIAYTIEAWDDWRDPDWKEVYDPLTDRINNPTPRQIEKEMARRITE